MLFLIKKEGDTGMKWDDFLSVKELDVCRLAILLAMTKNQEQEDEVISTYHEHGLKAAATTIYGYGISAEGNVIRNVINLCFNKRIIEKKRAHVHPVAHCVLEVAQSTRASDAIGQNFKFKAAVVRHGSEFSLCFYGDLAMHPLSGHKSMGVGYQILGA